MALIRCSPAVIERTLSILRAGGARDCESLVLWLARRTPGVVDVVEAYEPPYEASIDFFHIPPSGMRSIMSRLRRDRLHICDQVHSHPGEAFHSTADDRWAIVRHEGALSLVVPHFAATTTTQSFLNMIATFVLSHEDQWRAVSRHNLVRYLEITHADGTTGE